MHPQIEYDRGVVNKGDRRAVAAVMRRAMAGEDLTLAFLGGSITQGSLASKPELCYAYRVFDWWVKTFPKAHFTFVNAGIGATDSQFGCARVQEDVLVYHPDYVSVEYAVNDCATPHFCETFEGVIRQILEAENAPALTVMYNVCYDNGSSAELQHSKVVRHYDLPAVSMRTTIYPELLAGRIENREITPDDLHPNDPGHELVASVIIYMLEEIRKELVEEKCAGDGYKCVDGKGSATGGSTASQLPAPLTANTYQNSRRFRNDSDMVKECAGFTADVTPQEHITEIFRKGWTATEQGSKIVFEVSGSNLAVQYRKTMQLPAPIATVIIDGDVTKPITLDANFDETWGDKLVLDTLMEGGSAGKHTMEITLTETHPEDKLPFYLVSIIASGAES